MRGSGEGKKHNRFTVASMISKNMWDFSLVDSKDEAFELIKFLSSLMMSFSRSNFIDMQDFSKLPSKTVTEVLMLEVKKI